MSFSKASQNNENAQASFSLFINQMSMFAKQLLSVLKSSSMVDHISEIDHACYRVSTVEKYEEIRRILCAHGTLLSEALINGRPICTFRLNEKVILSDHWAIALVELPAPKSGATYAEGFEHIEAVTQCSLEEFMKLHATYSFRTENLGASINPDVSLRFGEGLVKFHEASLENVIAAEKKTLAKVLKRPVVLVDLDDTIANSGTAFLRAMHSALSKHFVHPVPFEVVQKNARPTFSEFFDAFGITGRENIGRILSDFRAAWPKHLTECTVPVGVESMLSCFKSEGIEINVWTARDDATTKQTLTHLRLDMFIDGVFAFDFTSESGTGKPVSSPELTRRCLDKKVVVIGDSSSDYAGARALNAHLVQATWVNHKIIPGAIDSVASNPHMALKMAMDFLH